MSVRVLLLGGDGVGPEVVDATVRVLEATGLDAEWVVRSVGAARLRERGDVHDPDLFELASSCDAVLLGAVGDPTVPEAEKAAVGVLLSLRKALGVWCNLRPVRTHPALASFTPLREEIVAGTDLLVVRELTGGLYFGDKGRTADGAYDSLVYTRAEIERIVRYGFGLAAARRGKLTSVDKANVLETSRLWRETVNDLAPSFPDVTVEHLYVDNASMQLILHPRDIDVLVTENMFGDILSDEAAVLAGGLGMLPSASLGSAGVGLYEPVHGTAPDIAGTGKANPTGAILSGAMLMRHAAGDPDGAAAIERAVDATIGDGIRTADIGGTATTDEYTNAIIERITRT